MRRTRRSPLRNSACSAPQSYRPEFDDTNVSGDFTVSYDLTDDVLAYVTYARSFKSGGINLSGLPLDANNQPITAVETVDPEKTNHYEAGLKTQLFSQSVTLNLSAFWTDIDDYQATVTNSQANVIRGYLANAEQDASAWRGVGIEHATDREPERVRQRRIHGSRVCEVPGCAVPAGAGRRHRCDAANPPSAPGTPGGFSPAACDISGQWLPGVSKVALSYGFEYDLPAERRSARMAARTSRSMAAIVRSSRRTRRARSIPTCRATRWRTSAPAPGSAKAGTCTAGCATRSARTTSNSCRRSRAAPAWSSRSWAIPAPTA